MGCQKLYQQHGNKGHVFNYDFNSTEKLVELYERLLKEKDEVIKMYKNNKKFLKRSCVFKK
jgi:hypothetical protein